MSYCQHGGLTCHDFGHGRATGDPEPRPIHILGEVKKKTDPFNYTCTSNIENCTHSYTIFQILLIHILFG